MVWRELEEVRVMLQSGNWLKDSLKVVLISILKWKASGSYSMMWTFELAGNPETDCLSLVFADLNPLCDRQQNSHSATPQVLNLFSLEESSESC